MTHIIIFRSEVFHTATQTFSTKRMKTASESHTVINIKPCADDKHKNETKINWLVSSSKYWHLQCLRSSSATPNTKMLGWRLGDRDWKPWETPTYIHTIYGLSYGSRASSSLAKTNLTAHNMLRAKRRFFNYNETCHTKQTNNALANCT